VPVAQRAMAKGEHPDRKRFTALKRFTEPFLLRTTSFMFFASIEAKFSLVKITNQQRQPTYCKTTNTFTKFALYIKLMQQCIQCNNVDSGFAKC